MSISYTRSSLFLHRLAYQLKCGASLQKALESEPDKRCVGGNLAVTRVSSGGSIEDVVEAFKLSRREKAFLVAGFRFAFVDEALNSIGAVHEVYGRRLDSLICEYVNPVRIIYIGILIHAVQLGLFEQLSREEAGLWAGQWLVGVWVCFSIIRYVVRNRWFRLADFILWLPFGRSRRGLNNRRFFIVLQRCLENHASFRDALRLAAAVEGSSKMKRRVGCVFRRLESGETLQAALKRLGSLGSHLKWVDSAEKLPFAAQQALSVDQKRRTISFSKKTRRSLAMLSLGPVYLFLLIEITLSTCEQISRYHTF